MYDLEITLHRSGAGNFRTSVGSTADAYDLIYRYLSRCWGIPVPSINEAAIVEQLEAKGEYRRDHAQYLVVVKRADDAIAAPEAAA